MMAPASVEGKQSSDGEAEERNRGVRCHGPLAVTVERRAASRGGLGLGVGTPGDRLAGRRRGGG